MTGVNVAKWSQNESVLRTSLQILVFFAEIRKRVESQKNCETEVPIPGLYRRFDPGSGIPDPGSRKSPIPKGNVLVRTDTYTCFFLPAGSTSSHLLWDRYVHTVVAAMILTDSTAIFILLCKEGRAWSHTSRFWPTAQLSWFHYARGEELEVIPVELIDPAISGTRPGGANSPAACRRGRVSYMI